MSGNLSEIIGKTIFDACKLSLKVLYKLLNIKPFYNMEEFFRKVQLKNKLEQYPTLI